MANGQNIGVNDAVIAAEQALESRLLELRLDTLNGAKQLISTYQENSSGLGAHSASIQALLEDLAAFATGDATAPIKKLTKRLKRDYTNRKDFMENNPYGSGRSR